MRCCTENWTANDNLPFRRILASGYYDGATEGITSCSICGQGFAFRMLAWDKNQDVRVFGFSQIAQNEKKIADQLGITLSTDKPVTLVPPLIQEKEHRFKLLFGRRLTHICVTEDLFGRAKLWRETTLQDKKVTDWLAYLAVL